MNNNIANKVLILASGILVLLIVFITVMGIVLSKSGVFDAFLGQTQKIAMTQAKESKKTCVADTCRAMMTSYSIDKRMYINYSVSEDEDRRSWGEQARLRANATAAEYNEYMLKNSHVFEGAIPDDIANYLELLQ